MNNEPLGFVWIIKEWALSKHFLISNIEYSCKKTLIWKNNVHIHIEYFKKTFKSPSAIRLRNLKRKNQGRKNEKAYSAFEARISKKIILEGLDKDLINQEEQVVSVEGVNGAFVKVGSLEEVDTSGNWPKIYDAEQTKQ